MYPRIPSPSPSRCPIDARSNASDLSSLTSLESDSENDPKAPHRPITLPEAQSTNRSTRTPIGDAQKIETDKDKEIKDLKYKVEFLESSVEDMVNGRIGGMRAMYRWRTKQLEGEKAETEVNVGGMGNGRDAIAGEKRKREVSRLEKNVRVLRRKLVTITMLKNGRGEEVKLLEDEKHAIREKLGEAEDRVVQLEGQLNLKVEELWDQADTVVSLRGEVDSLRREGEELEYSSKIHKATALNLKTELEIERALREQVEKLADVRSEEIALLQEEVDEYKAELKQTEAAESLLKMKLGIATNLHDIERALRKQGEELLAQEREEHSEEIAFLQEELERYKPNETHDAMMKKVRDAILTLKDVQHGFAIHAEVTRRKKAEKLLAQERARTSNSDRLIQEMALILNSSNGSEKSEYDSPPPLPAFSYPNDAQEDSKPMPSDDVIWVQMRKRDIDHSKDTLQVLLPKKKLQRALYPAN